MAAMTQVRLSAKSRSTITGAVVWAKNPSLMIR
jgi:hypothetical protein